MPAEKLGSDKPLLYMEATHSALVITNGCLLNTRKNNHMWVIHLVMIYFVVLLLADIRIILSSLKNKQA